MKYHINDKSTCNFYMHAMKGRLFCRHICLSCFKASVGPHLLSIYSNQLQFKRSQASFNCRIIWHVQFYFMVAIWLELRQAYVKYGRSNTFMKYTFCRFYRHCFVSCWFEIQCIVTHWWILAKMNTCNILQHEYYMVP